MSSADNPQRDPLGELEVVTRLLAEEVSAFRLRAQRAEAAQAEMSGGDYDVVSSRSRIVDLETENRNLQERLDEARQRVERLLARLRFLEEQLLADGAQR